MATSFDRWAKDPFFYAAEEVQESADRMESVYRLWVQERKQSAGYPNAGAEFAGGVLHRELQTALGTAKWQLEDLERAVRSNDEANLAGEDTRSRHNQFIEAIGSRISAVEDSLRESNLEAGERALRWVRLNEGERDELALFLSSSSPKEEKLLTIPIDGDLEVGNDMVRMNGEASVDRLKNSYHSNELSLREKREDKFHGHRRAVSASPDIGAWKISLSEGEDTSERSSDDGPSLPPRRIPSFSVLTGALESTSRMKWYRNGFRKWKNGYQLDATETIPLQNHQLSQGINACYERSKNCLSSCAEETSDKQLDGWFGAFHRQVQRLLYQIQYSRPIQLIFWAISAVMLIGLFALRAS